MGNVNRIAFCGVDCWECPARVATLKDDWFARRELAAEWTTCDYPVMAEDINCEGCQPGSDVLFIFCRECEIRLCGINRKVQTCASCSGFPCERIERAPVEVRARLMKMRA